MKRGQLSSGRFFWGCPIIEKSIATLDRAVGHITRPKLQIPFNGYGIMAITGQLILAFLRLSLPVMHKHSSSGYIQGDGFQNQCQHSEKIWIAKHIGFLLPGPYSTGEQWIEQGRQREHRSHCKKPEAVCIVFREDSLQVNREMF